MLIPDLLWFLLPVAAAGGWLTARKTAGRSDFRFWEHSQHFHNDLNQLLTAKEADEKLFKTLTDADTDAAETHVALGNLYRRRGEFDRAIRLHEAIVNRLDLDPQVRATARLALAGDFEAAGLADQAEQTLMDLLDDGYRQDDAYAALLQTHEREGDWQLAVTTALQCEMDTGVSLANEVAHYYCELAAAATKNHDAEDAHRLLDLALKHWPQCARAHVQLAGIALEAGQFKQAIAHYDKVESLDAALMPVIIESRFEALKGADDMKALEQFVLRIQSQKNAYSVIRTTRQVIADNVDEQTADRFFKDQILKRPSLKGLRDWAHDQLLLSKPGEREKVQIICNLLDQVMVDKPLYRCRSCGFQGNVMHWRCPGCASWDSVSTIIGVEGE